MYSHKEDWKRIRSAVSKQVIPRRVGNLTAPLCDITDDLLENLKEIVETNDGQIEDVTEKMTAWAFQSKFISSDELPFNLHVMIQILPTLCLERI